MEGEHYTPQEPPTLSNAARESFLGKESREGDVEGWDEIVFDHLQECRGKSSNEEEARDEHEKWLESLVSEAKKAQLAEENEQRKLKALKENDDLRRGDPGGRWDNEVN